MLRGEKLWERWKGTLESSGKQPAIWTPSSGWKTFDELSEMVAHQAPLSSGKLHAVSSSNPLFLVVETLRAWRDGAVFCPLESDTQLPPSLQRDEDLEFPEGICHLKLTSGSTSEPKAVMFDADGLAADEQQICEAMHLSPRHPNLAVISLAHSYGFSNLVLPLCLSGIPLMAAGDALPHALPWGIREVIKQAKTWFGNEVRMTLPAVPAMWKAWLQTDLMEEPWVQTAISAGAPLPLDLEKQYLERFGVKLHNFYGASECGGIAYDGSPTLRHSEFYIGEGMPGVMLKKSEEGCLIVQGETLFRGYWLGSTEQETNQERKFQTSDLVDLKPQPDSETVQVFLRGRISDLIHVAGRKISPATLEEHLLEVEGVELALVFGVPSMNPERVEEIVACVRLRNHDRSSLTPSHLAQRLGGKLPDWQIPRHWWIEDTLNVDARGKLSRSHWKKKWLSQLNVKHGNVS